MSQWLPISTAPKDGRDIVIWADGRAHIARWGADYDNPSIQSWVTDVESGQGGSICFHDKHEHASRVATRWLPLEAPDD